MNITEKKILNTFKDAKNYNYNEGSYSISVRDQIEIIEDQDIKTIKVLLWDSPILKYTIYNDPSINDIVLSISLCGFMTKTTLSRLRIFEDLFKFSIVNIKKSTYKITFSSGESVILKERLNTDGIPTSEDNTTCIINYSLSNNCINEIVNN